MLKLVIAGNEATLMVDPGVQPLASVRVLVPAGRSFAPSVIVRVVPESATLGAVVSMPLKAGPTVLTPLTLK